MIIFNRIKVGKIHFTPQKENGGFKINKYLEDNYKKTTWEKKDYE